VTAAALHGSSVVCRRLHSKDDFKAMGHAIFRALLRIE
jgi:hypothetical protein